MELSLYLKKIECDCCGSSDEEFLLTRSGVLTGYPFRLVRCKRCGFIYFNPRLNPEGTEKLYNKDYYELCDENRKYKVDSFITDIKAIHPPPARLLDLGCGLGTLLRSAQNEGYEVKGYEISPFAKKFAENNGFVIFDDLDEIPRRYFDIITCIEVLEHCFSPTELLMNASGYLRSGGLFYYLELCGKAAF
jgi:SAM-dependent methyltransferase